VAITLPLDSRRIHVWGGVLVHGTHSSQDSLAAPTAPSSRSPEGHQRRWLQALAAIEARRK
jgi:hypothetical protein